MGIKEELETRFKERELQIPLYPDVNAIQFATLDEFCGYMVKERDYWAECRRGKINEIWAHFEKIVAKLNEATTQADLNQAVNSLNAAINLASINKFPCVYSVTPVAKFIKDRFKEKYEYAEAAYQFFFEDSLNTGNKTYFEGYLSAFISTRLDKTAHAKLCAAEEALADLRKRYSDELTALHQQYLTRGDECSQKAGEMWGQYDDFCKTMTEWKAGIQQSADTLLQEKQKELEELKKLHSEQLRLKEPAKYWADLEAEYMTKGEKWKNRLIGSAVVFVAFLTAVLFKLPETLLPNGGFNMTSVKSTIMLAFIASIGMYVIHFFNKMSVSAYHMARDAKERYQLTHVYLSLMQEGAVTAEERTIVLQSLFSRVDTGLLKGDAGPTLPDVGMLGGTFKNIRPQ